jgi:hypothetical protein
MWLDTLKHLYALRQELMSGVGNLKRRQQAWERLYWKSADDRGDAKLAWPEVKKLCLRLNVHAPEADLKQRFKVQTHFLSRFLALMSLYRKLTFAAEGGLTLRTFRDSSSF